MFFGNRDRFGSAISRAHICNYLSSRSLTKRGMGYSKLTFYVNSIISTVFHTKTTTYSVIRKVNYNATV